MTPKQKHDMSLTSLPEAPPQKTRAGTRIRMRTRGKMASRWFDSERDELPSGIEPLLFRTEGVYYCGTFDAEKRLFRADDELRQTVFRIPASRVFWKRIIDVQ
jgi:hypothetical protein